MGILKDFLDVISDITTATKDASGAMSDSRMSSLSKESLEGTLQFPVLVSRSLDMETSSMISRALEKNYSSFVQVVLGMNPIFNTDGGKGVKDFIRKFHQNSDTKTGTGDFTNFISSDESSFYVSESENGKVSLITVITDGGSGKVYADNKKGLLEYMSDINMDSVNGNIRPVSEEYFINSRLVSEEFKTKYSPATEANRGIKREDPDFELPRDVLKWTQVQKFNELMPTHLIVKVKLQANDGSINDFQVIIGVKTTLHPIDSKEMVYNLVSSTKHGNKIFNFIKWTTGEISFFKDFLFNINGIKDDVVRRSAGASPWWITLKRRKLLAKVKNALFIPSGLLPNATIVVSMEEVNYIKAEFGYDFLNTYFVDGIMKSYFLLGFVVVDNSTQVVHMLFEGQSNFQSYSFTGLQKEADSKEDFKQMLKLINRI